jgi:transposase
MRADAILLLAKKGADHRLRIVAAKTGLSSATVMRIRDRANEKGIAALTEGLPHGRRVDPRAKTNLKAERAWPQAPFAEPGNLTTRALATKYGVSQSTASRWIRELRAR